MPFYQEHAVTERRLRAVEARCKIQPPRRPAINCLHSPRYSLATCSMSPRLEQTHRRSIKDHSSTHTTRTCLGCWPWEVVKTRHRCAAADEVPRRMLDGPKFCSRGCKSRDELASLLYESIKTRIAGANIHTSATPKEWIRSQGQLQQYQRTLEEALSQLGYNKSRLLEVRGEERKAEHKAGLRRLLIYSRVPI